MSTVNKIKKHFKFLGFAEWIDGKGLQVPNTDSLETTAGVYAFLDEDGNVQKIGKSSSNLKARLKGYSSFDRGLQRSLDAISNGKNVRIDESSARQRRAIKDNNFKGFIVYYAQVQEQVTNVLGVDTVIPSFCAHDVESKYKNMAILENQPLTFGNK